MSIGTSFVIIFYKASDQPYRPQKQYDLGRWKLNDEYVLDTAARLLQSFCRRLSLLISSVAHNDAVDHK